MKRQGKTGIWTYVTDTADGKILATAEWGTNFEFNKAEWDALPVIE